MTRLLDALFRLRLWLGWYPPGRITWDETGADWAPIVPKPRDRVAELEHMRRVTYGLPLRGWMGR